ncbi:MAG: phosphoadenosine phosphosulfate reductase, partial [alpha proteobacterium MED-G10]
MDLGTERLNKLNLEFGSMTPEKILEKSLDIFGDKISYVCSFGTESAILLHIISQIDKTFPIILLNTHFLFDQT